MNSSPIDCISKTNYSAPRQLSAQKNRATILIVEEDPGLCFLLEQCMRKSNYRTVSISTIHEVLQSLAENQIDLVLLDLMIPNSLMILNKEQLMICQSIRLQYSVPIVVLSELGPLYTKLYAQRLGAAASLSKPMHCTELFDCIQSTLVPCQDYSSTAV